MTDSILTVRRMPDKGVSHKLCNMAWHDDGYSYATNGYCLLRYPGEAKGSVYFDTKSVLNISFDCLVSDGPIDFARNIVFESSYFMKFKPCYDCPDRRSESGCHALCKKYYDVNMNKFDVIKINDHEYMAVAAMILVDALPGIVKWFPKEDPFPMAIGFTYGDYGQGILMRTIRG